MPAFNTKSIIFNVNSPNFYTEFINLNTNRYHPYDVIHAHDLFEGESEPSVYCCLNYKVMLCIAVLIIKSTFCNQKIKILMI